MKKLLSNYKSTIILLASIIIGAIVGFIFKEKSKPVVDFLESANEIINNVVKLIMYYAPIGLGCYFAALVGSFGEMYCQLQQQHLELVQVLHQFQ